MIITGLHEFIEEYLEISVHFVHLTEHANLPAATIRQVSSDHDGGISKTPTRKITLDLSLWSHSYFELDELLDLAYSELHYRTYQNDNYKYLMYVDDAEDDSYPNPDGSDDWVYQKSITLKLHVQPLA